MRIAVYLRASTLRQAQAQSCEQQLDRLQIHIRKQGLRLPPENIFRDDGYSGATLKRPGLDRLRDFVASAAVDRILITAPDRLARNYVHQVLLLEELQGSGCQVDFLDHPMSQDPHDQLLLQIRGAVAEYERTLIAERMRRGRLAKLHAGLILPWTRPPYGYRLDPQRPRDPALVRLEMSEASVVAEIFDWYNQQGRSLFGLAKHLEEQGIPSPSGKPYWSTGTLRGILTNPTYTGQVFAGRMLYRPPRVRRSATHPMGRPHGTVHWHPPEQWIAVAAIPAVVSQQQFELAQAKLRQNQSFARRNNKAEYLLRALVSCGRCLLACQARRTGSNKYYLCTGKDKGARQRYGRTCPSRFIPAQQLDDLVWQDLSALLAEPEQITQALARGQGGHWLPQELQSRRENLRKARVSLEHQLERLTEAYLSGVIPLLEYHRRRGELEQRQRMIEQQAEQLTAQADQRVKLSGLTESVEAFCRRVKDGLAEANFEQKRQLVELLIDRVVVTDDQVEIRYVIPTSPKSERVRFCQLRSDYFGDPELIDRGEGQSRHHVRIHGQRVVGICRADESSLAQTKQIILAHKAQHPLVIGFYALAVKFCRYAAIAILWPIKSNALDMVAQFCIRVWLSRAGLMAVMSSA